LTPKSNLLPQETRVEAEEADSAAETGVEMVAEAVTVMTDEEAEDTMTDEAAGMTIDEVATTDEVVGMMTEEVVETEDTIDGMTDEALHDETTTGRSQIKLGR